MKIIISEPDGGGLHAPDVEVLDDDGKPMGISFSSGGYTTGVIQALWLQCKGVEAVT